MSDRWIFVTAFLTVVLIVASAFAIPQLFAFQLLLSSIYLVISLLVFFGEDRFSYMLGIVTPPLWFVLDILLGGFFSDFRVLWNSIAMKPIPASETPLNALAVLLEAVLLILCVRAWRKQVSEKFLGKTFGICLLIALAYIVILAVWYLRAFSGAGGMA